MRLTIPIIFMFFVSAMIATSYGAISVPAGVGDGGAVARFIAALPPEAAFAAPILPALAVMMAFGVLRFVALAITFAGTLMVVGVLALTLFNAEFKSLIGGTDLSTYRQRVTPTAVPAPAQPQRREAATRPGEAAPFASQRTEIAASDETAPAHSAVTDAVAGNPQPDGERDPIADLLTRY